MRELQERPAFATLSRAPTRRAGRAAVPVLLAVATVVVALDQLAKWWALERLSQGPIHVFWTLDLRLTFNSGAAFGLGRGLGPILVAGGVALLVAILVLGRSASGRTAPLALGLLLGGAVGNLADRLLRDHGGAVVDFVDLGWWPVFNLADASIVVGALVLVLAPGHRAGGRNPAE